jgi:hypothetical protein
MLAKQVEILKQGIKNIQGIFVITKAHLAMYNIFSIRDMHSETWMIVGTEIVQTEQKGSHLNTLREFRYIYIYI